jgi:hypothetical protein
MIKNISQYFNVFKKPKTLKMRANEMLMVFLLKEKSFKRKTMIHQLKIKNLYDSLHPYKKAPNITVTGGAGIRISGGITTAIDGLNQDKI